MWLSVDLSAAWEKGRRAALAQGEWAGDGQEALGEPCTRLPWRSFRRSWGGSLCWVMCPQCHQLRPPHLLCAAPSPVFPAPVQLALGPPWCHQPSGAGISSTVTTLKHWATHLSLLFLLWSNSFSVSSLISAPGSYTFLGSLNLSCTDNTFTAVDTPTCSAAQLLLVQVMLLGCWLLQLSLHHLSPSLLPSACRASHGTTGL